MKHLIICNKTDGWLTANLGPTCLAGLTGTDARALLASVQIVELWTINNSIFCLEAWGQVVVQMQESTRHLAYHAVAQVANWEDRRKFWPLAFGPLPTGRCRFEPV